MSDTLSIKIPRSVATYLHTAIADLLRSKRHTSEFRRDLALVAVQLACPPAAVDSYAAVERERMHTMPLSEAVDILHRHAETVRGERRDGRAVHIPDDQRRPWTPLTGPCSAASTPSSISAIVPAGPLAAHRWPVGEMISAGMVPGKYNDLPAGVAATLDRWTNADEAPCTDIRCAVVKLRVLFDGLVIRTILRTWAKLLGPL